MPDHPVSRRMVVGALAGGVVGATMFSATSSTPELPAADELGAAQPASTERRLLAPLAEGSQLLDWEIVAIEPLSMGAMRVQLRGEDGVAFGVEVMAGI